MSEKFEVKKENEKRGICIFSLNYIGITPDGYKSCFMLKITDMHKCLEMCSETFVASSMYDSLLRAFLSGKDALKRNNFDPEIAYEAFKLYQDKIQFKFPY